MWRYPFVNFCFVILIIAVLSIQHSVAVFGPTVHSRGVAAGDESQRNSFMWDAAFPGTSLVVANFNRAAALLNDTWHRGMAFKEWLMEYNATQWEVFRALSPAEADLIEARFHVANAEVFTEGMSENDRAIRELDRAASSVQAVQTLVKDNLTPQLTTIRAEITAAELDEKKDNAAATVPFETIKADLDHLIETLRLS
jgi:hypothetical protein